MRVFVYFNLHKKVWSIKSLKTNKVIDYTNTIILKDCKFKVSEAGRQRVLSTGHKNIHAGVVGEIVDYQFDKSEEVTYNPRTLSTFVKVKDRTPIFEADYVLMQNKKVYVNVNS
jgi:hypothetical protein